MCCGGLIYRAAGCYDYYVDSVLRVYIVNDLYMVVTLDGCAGVGGEMSGAMK